MCYNTQQHLHAISCLYIGVCTLGHSKSYLSFWSHQSLQKHAGRRVIRTSGLALQTLSACMPVYCNEALHGLNLVPGTIHAESCTYLVSLFWNFIFSAYNMYLHYSNLYEYKKCHI